MSESVEGCTFSFDGAAIKAKPGQTIAGALHDSHQHIISRSFKYHRPRGLFCASGRCPNCLCTVDGEPNVRICIRQAVPGIVVNSQNAWPSLKFDLLAIFDKLHKLMPVGFYYKVMHKPRFMWPVFEKFIRRVAGLGHVDFERGGEGEYDKLNRFSEIAVVGGGWTGLHAALEAAHAGATVTLIDNQPQLGGHMRHDPVMADERLADLIGQIAAHHNIEVIDSATVFGAFEENYLGIQRGNRLIKLRADRVVFTTGAWERPYVFENNDLPGNLLASGAQRLLQLEGCKFDGTAIVVTDNLQGYRTAAELSKSGTDVAAIIELNDEPCTDPGDIQVLTGHTILAARGRKQVNAAIIEPIQGGPLRTIDCRWIIQAVGFTPATSLLYQSGCKLKHDPERDQPRVEVYAPGTDSAGAVNGTHARSACALEGRRAGLAAVSSLRPEDASLKQRVEQLTLELERLDIKQRPPKGHYVSSSPAKKKFVCLCEDVTEQDLCDAIDEGYSNIETLKRYSTISMGPCQGKMCQAASIAICARHNGKTIQQTGITTSRPPEQPLPLGVLAGRATKFGLTRRTALHHWHEAAGAKFMDAGAWKRPEWYTDPVEEYQAVRNRVGLIDVSTLGKIDLRGTGVVEFLEFIYPNRFAKLRVGRVRYGAVCDEAGIILDDGMICHVEQNRFYLSTSTGNAEAIDSWFRWWLTCKQHLDVRMANLSGSFAAMNLAGPQSREVLSKLTGADLSHAALPFPSVAQFDVAGVPAIVLRIGFVGELGYEVHVPTQFGLHVWKSIMAAGVSFGIKPFGVEAQRMLRLDKKHLLPGTDTDALSNPIEAGLPWIIKLDKQDFIGKASLQRAEQRGPQNRLVGFRMEGNTVPDDASLVIHRGKLGGRVTSARYSPAAGAIVGLAWVPIETADNGATIDILLNGKTVTAVIQDEPFYDPQGERLRL